MPAEPVEISATGPHPAGPHPDEAAPACGCAHDDDEVVLDVRTVPHAVRHGAVFGSLAAVPPGSSLVLVAPHDPLPLLAQLEDREPGAFEITYLLRDPAEHRLRLTRRPT